MTVEHELTRALDIRFIDARSIVNEAKVGLKIQGYSTPEQDSKILSASMRIFKKRSESDKNTMRRLSASLEDIKAGSSMEFSDAGSSCGSFSVNGASSSSSPSIGSRGRKSIFQIGRR